MAVHAVKAHISPTHVPLQIPLGEHCSDFTFGFFPAVTLLPRLYRRKFNKAYDRRQSPFGLQRIPAVLPAHVQGHFGVDLHRLAVKLHHQGQTTVAHITELLNDWELRISKRSVMYMPNEGTPNWSTKPMTCSLHVDDTGARYHHRKRALGHAPIEAEKLTDTVNLSDDSGQFKLGRHAIW